MKVLGFLTIEEAEKARHAGGQLVSSATRSASAGSSDASALLALANACPPERSRRRPPVPSFNKQPPPPQYPKRRRVAAAAAAAPASTTSSSAGATSTASPSSDTIASGATNTTASDTCSNGSLASFLSVGAQPAALQAVLNAKRFGSGFVAEQGRVAYHLALATDRTLPPNPTEEEYQLAATRLAKRMAEKEVVADAGAGAARAERAPAALQPAALQPAALQPAAAPRRIAPTPLSTPMEAPAARSSTTTAAERLTFLTAPPDMLSLQEARLAVVYLRHVIGRCSACRSACQDAATPSL